MRNTSRRTPRRGTKALVMGLLVAGVLAACGNPSTSAPTSVNTTPTPQEEITSFDEFPVLWLGDSYDSDGDGVGDLPLRLAQASRGLPITDPKTGRVLSPSIRSFDVSFGDCDIPKGKQSCAVPITIHFYPPSGAPQLAPGLVENTVPLRGIDAMQYGPGRLMIATADVVFTVSVSIPGEADSDSQAVRIVNGLRGANPKASLISESSDFPPAAKTTQ